MDDVDIRIVGLIKAGYSQRAAAEAVGCSRGKVIGAIKRAAAPAASAAAEPVADDSQAQPETQGQMELKAIDLRAAEKQLMAHMGEFAQSIGVDVATMETGEVRGPKLVKTTRTGRRIDIGATVADRSARRERPSYTARAAQYLAQMVNRFVPVDSGRPTRLPKDQYRMWRAYNMRAWLSKPNVDKAFRPRAA